MEQDKPTRSYIVHRKISEIEHSDVIHAFAGPHADVEKRAAAPGLW
jgi:hypothetical protein